MIAFYMVKRAWFLKCETDAYQRQIHGFDGFTMFYLWTAGWLSGRHSGSESKNRQIEGGTWSDYSPQNSIGMVCAPAKIAGSKIGGAKDIQIIFRRATLEQNIIYHNDMYIYITVKQLICVYDYIYSIVYI